MNLDHATQELPQTLPYPDSDSSYEVEASDGNSEDSEPYTEQEDGDQVSRRRRRKLSIVS